MNIGSGWERKSIMQRCPFIFIIRDGELAEQPDSWAKGHFAAAHIIPKTTGSYFIIVSVEESPAARTHWALAYGFR